ncbi:hypothetical protein TI04_04020 [Achromatium sp. WMS2]|nr:hypothetical protein TI04_04020 [Achromatium sp. WMS2]
MNRTRSFTGLTWVSGELSAVIREARESLEQYVENGGNNNALNTAVNNLSQVRGILQMLHLTGAARLAEEMQASATAILESTAGDPQEAAEPLMLALILLPDYIEKLESTNSDDLPALLLGTINDLRRSRGASILQETDLVLAELMQTMAAERTDSQTAESLQQHAAQIRPKLLQGILTWVKGPNHKDGLHTLREIFSELAKKTTETPLLHGILRALEAITAGIIEGSVPQDNNVKSLILSIDRNIKDLAEQGLKATVSGIKPQQFRDVLHLIAHTQSNNPLITAVQTDYELARIFPSESTLAAGRIWLDAPSTSALTDVRSAAIKELLPIKDTLDLFMRSSRSDVTQLQELTTPIQRLANTLQMIGLDGLSKRLHKRIADLNSIGNGKMLADDNILMGIASDLLFVESSLDSTSAELDISPDSTIPKGEMRSLMVRTLREAAVDMTKAKEAIVNYIDRPSDIRPLEDTPSLFHGIAGALRVISHGEAASILDKVRKFVQHTLVTRSVDPTPSLLDALADSIASIEYYMEAVADGRTDVANILEIAGKSLTELLSYETTETDTVNAANYALPPAAAEIIAADSSLDVKSSVSSTAITREATPNIAATKPTAPEIDPEILEIFIEEAREAQTDIQNSFGRWRTDSNDSEALTVLRRSFHTIKGSGRIAGALDIGEFGWVIENLLNKVIDQTLVASPAVLIFLDQAIEVLPELITAQEQNRPPNVDLGAIARRADELLGKIPPGSSGLLVTSFLKNDISKQDVIEQQSQLAADSLNTSTTEDAADYNDIWVESAFDDTELRNIFENESKQHVATVEEFINNCQGKLAPYKFDSKISRAFHTLAGSANMAGITEIAVLAKALERKAEYLLGQNLAADTKFLALVTAGASAIKEMLVSLEQFRTVASSAELVRQVEAYIHTPPDNEDSGNTFIDLDSGEFRINIDLLSNTDVQIPAADGSQDAPVDNYGLENFSFSLPTESESEPQTEPKATSDDAYGLESFSFSLPAEPEIHAEVPPAPDGNDNYGLENFSFSLPTESESEPQTEPKATSDDAYGLESFSFSLSAEPEIHAEVPPAPDGNDNYGLENFNFSLPTKSEPEPQPEPKATSDDAYRLESFSFTVSTEPEFHAEASPVSDNNDGLESFSFSVPTKSESEPESQPEPKATSDDAYGLESFSFTVSTEPESKLESNAEVAPTLDANYDLGGFNLTLPAELDQSTDLEITTDHNHVLENVDVSISIASQASSTPDPEPSSAPLPVPDHEDYEDIQIDEELQEIFVEEAREILDGLAANIEEWQAAQHNPELSKEAKRLLHTLKGSARLAGIYSIGTLCQTVETLVISATPQVLKKYSAIFPMVHKIQKHLKDQLNQVNQGGPVAKKNRAASRNSSTPVTNRR